MYIRLLQDAKFFEFLFRCDRDLAETARGEGCGRCPGRLHAANYSRKPRGCPPGVDSNFSKRFSFCCDTEGCRSRNTPPSMRFLDRRVYLAAIVILASAMEQGSTPARKRQLRELLGVSPRTLARWRTWWRIVFSKSRFWKGKRGMFREPLRVADLPRALLDQFHGDPRDRLLSLLLFLARSRPHSATGCLMAAPDPQKMRAVPDPRSE